MYIKLKSEFILVIIVELSDATLDGFSPGDVVIDTFALNTGLIDVWYPNVSFLIEIVDVASVSEVLAFNSDDLFKDDLDFIGPFTCTNDPSVVEVSWRTYLSYSSYKIKCNRDMLLYNQQLNKVI